MNNKTIIAIGAHYDDIELSCGGTLAQAIDKHYKVVAIITSLSDYNKYDGTIIRSPEQAHFEGHRALEILGIKEKNIFCLKYHTKEVPYDHTVIEKLNTLFDRYRPSQIIIPHINDTHPDHANTAKSAISAGRYYSNIIMYESFYPSNIAYRNAFKPVLYYDISKYMTLKLKSLKAHKGEIKNHDFWNDLVLANGRLRGIEIKTQYAECFEPIKLIGER